MDQSPGHARLQLRRRSVLRIVVSSPRRKRRVVLPVAVALVMLTGAVLVSASAGAAPGSPAVPAAAAAAGATYVPLGPVRVLDTRNGTGGFSGPVGQGGVLSLPVEGVAGVPATGVTAVVLNVTVTQPSTGGYLSAYPDGQTHTANSPSNLNFSAGETIPNLVVVPVGSDGKVDFYNNMGTTQLVVDLAGYYTTSATAGGSSYNTTGPVRVLDTRNGTGGFSAPVGQGGVLSLPVEGRDGVPASRVTAVVLNVTVTQPSTGGFLAAYPDGQTRTANSPSNLNFSAGETIPNLVVVPVGADGNVDFYNNMGTTHLVVDLAGYYTAGSGSAYVASGPVRVLDTRNGTGGFTGPVGQAGVLSLPVEGRAGVPSSGVTAVVLNVTVTQPSTGGFLAAYPDGQTRTANSPSNLNFSGGETIPNLVIVPVGADGNVDFYNNMGTTHLVVDLEGYYTAGGTPWGNAIEVPGTAALNTGSPAVVASVSCPSAGNCTVGGQYADQPAPALSAQAFVSDQVNGTWRNAIEIPGLAALNTGNGAAVSSVSCASAGNCAAGGAYTDSSAKAQAFVADEAGGVWSDAIEVPGTAALNTGNGAQVFSVSCPSAGNCALGGYYTDSSNSRQAFVADEAGGVWGNAIEVPGSAALNTSSFGDAEVHSVSCPSAGNCAVGGFYNDTTTGLQAFVADEAGGVWHDAIEVPGTAALNTGGTGTAAVSCASAGNCVAGGQYTVKSTSGPYPSEAYVADEVSGIWGDAIEVPGTAALNTGQVAFASSVSCPSAGNCAVGGELAVGSGSTFSFEPFVASEVNGTWEDAIQISGTPANALGNADVAAISCPSAGNCVAGIYASNAPSIEQAFVVSEVNGIWGEASQVPGTDNAVVNSVSCPPAGACAAGGEYIDSSSRGQAFVVSQT